APVVQPIASGGVPIGARRCGVWSADIGVDSGVATGAVVINYKAVAVWVAVIDVALRTSRCCGGDQDARNQNKLLHGCTSSFHALGQRSARRSVRSQAFMLNAFFGAKSARRS